MLFFHAIFLSVKMILYRKNVLILSDIKNRSGGACSDTGRLRRGDGRTCGPLTACRWQDLWAAYGVVMAALVGRLRRDCGNACGMPETAHKCADEQCQNRPDCRMPNLGRMRNATWELSVFGLRLKNS